jgi:predicted permease
MLNLRLALRSIVRTPFVTAIAVLSLALGIGANIGVFSLFDQVLLRPLPVSDPGGLVNLSAPGPKPGSQSCNQAGSCNVVFSYPMFRDLERQQTVFTGLAAHRLLSANMAYRHQTLNGNAVLVSGSYFPVLGVRPALGRLLGPQDDRSIGESAVVVLSFDYWRTRFDASPTVLNDVMIVNGQSMTIVGVAPRGFDGTTFGTKPQIFVPITMRGLLQPGFDGFDKRRRYWAYVFGRLKPGVSIEQAQTALNVQYHGIINDVEAPLQTGMSDATMTRFRSKAVIVEPGPRGQSSIHREGRPPLILLLSVTGLVLLIACANIANLLLARGATRASEMAVRLSIGAGRRHLIAQLMTESCLLAALGGAAGLVVAKWTLHLIASFMPASTATAFSMALDTRLLVFAALLSLATGFVFGLFPALHSTRPNLITAIKNQAGQPAGGRRAATFRSALVVSQVALSLALLFAAGIFTRSLYNVSRVNLGIVTDRLVTFAVSPELNGYDVTRSWALFERLEEELAALPGVSAVSTAAIPVLAGSSSSNDVSVEGYQAGPDTDSNAAFNILGPGYFRTLGVPLLAGREFSRADAMGTAKVAVVNEQFAKRFNLGKNPVGKRMARTTGQPTLDIEIVGLVKDTKYSEVKDAIRPQFFTPYRQDDSIGALSFYVRTTLDPTQILFAVTKVVARVDPNLPIEEMRTMTEQIRENVFADRMITVLSAAFAGLATLLAAVGLYGVLAYTVTQRTREIGLRMAIGAAPATVRRMVLGQVARLTVVGTGLGLAAAFGLGRGAQSLLFELKGFDPAIAVAATAILGTVALAAGLVPALRASRIDPIKALRDE